MTMIDFAATLALVRPATLQLDQLRDIEGWLTDEAIDLTSRLSHLQRSLDQAKGVLELGVFKGKYLALLSALYNTVPVVGVDGFLARLGEPLEPQWRATAEHLIRANVALMVGAERTVNLVGGLTRDVDIAEIVGLCPTGYGFISVDAGHEAEDLVVDLSIAAAAAAADAIIALDDVFNPLVPGVADGVCRFFYDNPGCPFRPFAICGNKVFLSGMRMHATYSAYTKWLLSVATDTTYIRNSAAQAELNRKQGFTPRFLGSEVVVFGWN